eukprot:4061241-Pyramimonas_sp.AAC.1
MCIRDSRYPHPPACQEKHSPLSFEFQLFQPPSGRSEPRAALPRSIRTVRSGLTPPTNGRTSGVPICDPNTTPPSLAPSPLERSLRLSSLKCRVPYRVTVTQVFLKCYSSVTQVSCALPSYRSLTKRNRTRRSALRVARKSLIEFAFNVS